MKSATVAIQTAEVTVVLTLSLDEARDLRHVLGLMTGTLADATFNALADALEDYDGPLHTT